MSRLENVDGALWLAEGEIVSFYGFPYPTRGAIARLADGRLWVWSPIRLDAELRGEIDRLGRVAHLVSPNKLHHLYLAEWKTLYPEAKLWGPESTVRRRRNLAFGRPLKDSPPAEWGPDFDQAWFRGSFALDEIVFFHRPSRTALVADLIQAFDDRFLRENWSWWRRPLAHLDGIAAANPGAPREWRLSFTDRAAARAARDKALSWNCERVIVAHGEWRRSSGQEFLRRALAWLGPDLENA
jgi:Domain of unknown function (DUF4336)